MLNLLWIVPALPLVGFVLLVFGRLPRKLAACVGVGSIGLAALITLLIALQFLNLPADEQVFRQILWTWFGGTEVNVGFTLYLDPLSMVMMAIITGVGFLIHLYSVGYMADDAAFNRFFAYMNLFIVAMLLLVLGDNLVLLYLGFEGVGLCSYLLIGFWYDNPDNGYAARKAFIVTRISDTFLVVGLLFLFMHLGTLDIQPLMQQANELWQPGSWLPVLAASLLLIGALGKSAQLPLQIWLPDAMAGPTPISALIHAATMVTAGVYLIARTHELFLLAPQVMVVIAIIGAATLVISGFSAMVQTDIKRILAYSTMSQLGYMFLALGVGAWSAAIFHLMTHAFFKALLFLAAGAVIISLNHEQNIFKMGGLRKRLPLSFWSFMFGGLALAALPLTSGYYSKHEILMATASFEHSGQWLWLAGVVGAVITGVYTFRMIFIVFFGEQKGEHKKETKESFGKVIRLPLLVLIVLSIAGGWIPLPFAQIFPASDSEHASNVVNWITILAPFVGIVIAYLCFYKHSDLFERLSQTRPSQLLRRFWFSGWGFDWFYGVFFISPFMWLVAINKNDVVDGFYSLLTWFTRLLYRLLSLTQTGRVRWYAAIMVVGVVGFVGLGVMR